MPDRLTGFVFAMVSFIGGFIGTAYVMESWSHSPVEVVIIESKQGSSELFVGFYGYQVHSRTSNNANSLSNEGHVFLMIPPTMWLIAASFCAWLGWRCVSRITRRGAAGRLNSKSTEAEDYEEKSAG